MRYKNGIWWGRNSVPSWDPIKECPLKYMWSSNDDSWKCTATGWSMSSNTGNHTQFYVYMFFFFKRIQETWLFYVDILGEGECKEKMVAFNVPYGNSFSVPTIWMITLSAFTLFLKDLAVSTGIGLNVQIKCHLLWFSGLVKGDVISKAYVEKQLGCFLCVFVFEGTFLS